MPMNQQEVWEAWAPEHAWWSPWAKPVLIAQLRPEQCAHRVSLDWQSVDVSGLPTSSDRAAIVIDLGGADSVLYAMALAKRGFRPVPLFNACSGPNAIVPVEGLQAAMIEAASELAAMAIDNHAPPAFLLDANRLEDTEKARPGQFDNRWMTFPQDFPSGSLLIARQIEMAVLLQDGSRVGEDLAHVLLEWKDAGIRLQLHNRKPGTAQSLTVLRPHGYRALWHRALAVLGLKRNSAGGFGSLIPEPVPEGGYRGGHGGGFGFG